MTTTKPASDCACPKTQDDPLCVHERLRNQRANEAASPPAPRETRPPGEPWGFLDSAIAAHNAEALERCRPAAAPRETSRERCLAVLMLAQSVRCDLTAGHPGHHETSAGLCWFHRGEQIAPAPSPCPDLDALPAEITDALDALQDANCEEDSEEGRVWAESAILSAFRKYRGGR